MSTDDQANPSSRQGPLRRKYGGKTAEAINRAIRAEVPGGDEALDRLRDWRMICSRLGWGDGLPEEPLHVTAYRHLLEIVDAMEEAVRERYGLPPAPERDDLRRRR